MLFSYTYWSDPQCELGMKARTMALRTLDKMADGGIHDHVAKVREGGMVSSDVSVISNICLNLI